MRVLMIIDSLAVGGAEQSLSMIAPFLASRGVELHVAYLVERRGITQTLRNAGTVLHSLDGPGRRIRGVGRTMRLIRKIRPDLVHTTLFEADIVGRTAAGLLRVPVVSSFVTEAYGPEHYENPEYTRWKVRAAQVVDAITARFVTTFHAVSASSADLMAARLRVSRNNVVVIPRGRDPKLLGVKSVERRRSVRREFGYTEEEPLVLAVGRHYHMKGLDILVKCFADVRETIPDAQLLIIGRDGPATPELERLIAEPSMDTSVTLAGYRRDVADLMSAADVVVLPSRTEGSPGALIEAMALGVPVVASDIPSVREVAGDDAAALLVPVDSPRDMSTAIVKLLDDDRLATQLGAAGSTRFEERYTMDSIAADTVALYRSAIER